MSERRVTVERIGDDVWLVRVGDTTMALSYVEMMALRYEVNAALDG